jgi:hypothetical protein
MKYFLISFLLAGATAFAQDAVPEIPFDSNANLLKLPPDLYLGEVSGVAVNSKGHIFVYSRGNSTGPAYAATAAQLLEFGPDGKYIREIGKNLYAWSFAHAVRVDKDDNIWAVDKGSDMMIKFNPEGRVVMVFGRKKEASDEGAEAWKHPRPPLPAVDGQFRQPTDVTWDTQGNIFFSDGYINSRVAKFDKNGHWVKSWGTPAVSQGNSTHRTASQPMPKGTSMSPTVAIAAFRCSILMAASCAKSKSTYPCQPTRRRGWARSPRKAKASPAPCRPALRGLSASRPGRRNTFTRPTLFPAAFTR